MDNGQTVAVLQMDGMVTRVFTSMECGRTFLRNVYDATTGCADDKYEFWTGISAGRTKKFQLTLVDVQTY